MRKLFTILLALTCANIIFAAKYDCKIDGIYYNLNETNKTATVTNRVGGELTKEACYFGSVVIPSSITYNLQNYSVTTIGDYSFFDCNNLISITISNSIIAIGARAFWGCSSLTSVTIGDSVNTIGTYAFQGCYGLTSVTIGNSVTTIGEKAFYGCNGITLVNLECAAPPTLGTSVFCNFNNCIFNIPCGTMEDYQLAWGTKYNFSEVPPYHIELIADYGTISSLTSYSCTNNTIQLLVTADEHHYFSQWSDGNEDNPRTVTVIQDTTFTAFFTPKKYTISTTTSKYGIIEGAGTYDYGKTITLTVIPNNHYHFVKWSDGNTSNPRQVTVSGDITYTAVFEIDQHRVVANAIHGYVEGSGMYDYGSFVTLTAQPDDGYRFVKWSNGNDFDPYVFVIEDDITIEAIFELVTDALDEVTDTAQPRKVMIDGNIYMQVNDNLYNVIGNKIK